MLKNIFILSILIIATTNAPAWSQDTVNDSFASKSTPLLKSTDYAPVKPVKAHRKFSLKRLAKHIAWHTITFPAVVIAGAASGAANGGYDDNGYYPRANSGYYSYGGYGYNPNYGPYGAYYSSPWYGQPQPYFASSPQPTSVQFNPAATASPGVAGFFAANGAFIGPGNPAYH